MKADLAVDARACKVLDMLVDHRQRLVDEALEEAHDLAHFTGLAHWVYLRGDGDVLVYPEAEGLIEDCDPMMCVDLSN